MDDPIAEISAFLDSLWAKEELAPICLSTKGLDGFPNSRFVDLKKASEEHLYFGSDSRSTKAKEFDRATEVALCAWWPTLQIQVRVRGTAEQASVSISDNEFAKRNPTAQAIAAVSVQSREIANLDELRQRVRELQSRPTAKIPRPPTWWIYSILPSRIEILRFSEDRIHIRTEYQRRSGGWSARMLSP